MSIKFSDLKEFTVAQLKKLQKEYEPLRGKTISIPNANKLGAMMDRLSKMQLKVLAAADIPFVTTSAISKLVMKHGMKFTDFTAKQLNMSEADELQTEACWTGYKQVGLKKKGNKMVPNCVPESVVKEMFGDIINEINDLRGSFSNAQLERMKQEWKNKPASALTQGVKQMIMNMDSPTRAALENAKINHISKFAGSTFEQKESVDPSCKICEGEACQCAQGEDLDEAKNLNDLKRMLDKTTLLTPKEKKDIQSLEKSMGSKGYQKVLKQMFSEDIQEGMVKRVMQTIHDKLSKEGGAAGFDDLAKEVKKEFGITITKDTLKNMPGVKQHRDGDYILEADLSKSQVKMVHKAADKMSKKDFVQRYGKDGDSVRYATATNMVKKKLGIAEMTKEKINKGENKMQEQSYKDKFNATMKDFGIKSLGDLKSDDEKKKFFKAVDAKHDAKDEMKKMNAMKMKEDEVAPEPMKKLNVGDKKEMKKMKEEAEPLTRDTMSLADKDPINAMKMNAMKMPIRSMKMNAMKDMDSKDEMMKKEMMKKEMMKKMEMMKAETDPEKMEMMKKEIMTNMKNMDSMDKEEMMKKMEMAMKEYGTMMAMKMKEGFASDAQRRAAFASGYKEKGKDKKEMMSKMNAMKKMNSMKKMNANVNIDKDEMKKMNAMKMKEALGQEPMKKMDSKGTEGGAKTDADMSKVKDKQKPLMAMMKKEKYLPLKAGSIQAVVAEMQMKEQELVEVKGNELEKMIQDYLRKGGTIKKLPPALAKGMKPSEMKPHEIGKMGIIKSMKMKEVREFVDTYNKHFLLNYKAEELINEVQ